MARVECPHCQQPVTVSVEADRVVSCPHCGQAFQMPPAPRPAAQERPPAPLSPIVAIIVGPVPRNNQSLVWAVVITVGLVVSLCGLSIVAVFASRLSPPPAAEPRPPAFTAVEQRYIRACLKENQRLGPHAVVFLEPLLVARTMRTGDVGRLGEEIEVIQVPSPGNILGEVDGRLYWFTEISTRDVVDGRRLSIVATRFEVLGPVSYTSTIGARNTVMELRIVDFAAARGEARRQVEAWRSKERGKG